MLLLNIRSILRKRLTLISLRRTAVFVRVVVVVTGRVEGQISHDQDSLQLSSLCK